MEIFAKEPNITQRPWSKSRRRLDIHMSCICSEMMILREWVMANWSLTEKGRYARLVQKNETKFDEFDVFFETAVSAKLVDDVYPWCLEKKVQPKCILIGPFFKVSWDENQSACLSAGQRSAMQVHLAYKTN